MDDVDEYDGNDFEAETCNSGGSSPGSNKKDEANGNIVGIVLGVIFGILLIAGGIVTYIYYQKRKGNVGDHQFQKLKGPIREVTVISLVQMEPLSFSEQDEDTVVSPIPPIQSMPRAKPPSATGFIEQEPRTTTFVNPPLPEARTGSAPSSTGYHTENGLIHSLRMPNALTGRLG